LFFCGVLVLKKNSIKWGEALEESQGELELAQGKAGNQARLERQFSLEKKT